MTVETALQLLLGLVVWEILKHLYHGAKLWRLHRQARRLHRQARRWDEFLAWRRARVANSRVTLPVGRTNLEGPSPVFPYLGMDIPVFAPKSEAS